MPIGKLERGKIQGGRAPSGRLVAYIFPNQLETAKVEVLKPFPREEELQTKLARLEELNALLNMDKREPEIVAETEAPDNSQQPLKRKTTELER